jgi:hypothetical protein
MAVGIPGVLVRGSKEDLAFIPAPEHSVLSQS